MGHEGWSDEGHEEGEEGGQRDEEGSHEESDEEGQGDRGGMRQRSGCRRACARQILACRCGSSAGHGQGFFEDEGCMSARASLCVHSLACSRFVRLLFDKRLCATCDCLWQLLA